MSTMTRRRTRRPIEIKEAEHQLWTIVRAQRAAGRTLGLPEILAHINALEPDQARVMHLVFLDRLSVRAAAKKLGISHVSVIERLRWARLNLAAALAAWQP